MADKKEEKAKDKGAKKEGAAAKEQPAKAAAPKAGGAPKGGKDAGKGRGKAAEAAAPAADDGAGEKLDPNYKPRLRLHYQKTVAPALIKRFGYKNPMMAPRLTKVVINMGLGAAVGNPKIIDS